MILVHVLSSPNKHLYYWDTFFIKVVQYISPSVSKCSHLSNSLCVFIHSFIRLPPSRLWVWMSRWCQVKVPHSQSP